MSKIFKQDGEEAGLYDVCEWFLEFYPKDIFNLKNHPVTKIREESEKILKLRKSTKQKDKRIKCIYCNNPIHIDDWAGISKKGFICKNFFCLMQLAKEWKNKRDDKNNTKKIKKRNL